MGSFNIRHSTFAILHSSFFMGRISIPVCPQHRAGVRVTRRRGGSGGGAGLRSSPLSPRLRVTRLLFCSEARTQCREALRFFAPVLLASRLLARAGALLLPAFFFAPGLAV